LLPRISKIFPTTVYEEFFYSCIPKVSYLC
jgi:hypothetical protein